MIELSSVLVAENLIVALVLAAVWAALRSRRSRRPYAWLGLTGVCTGLATLTHQNAIVLLVPLLIAAWTGTDRKLAATALVAGAAVLTIAPWTIRNAVVMHHLIPVSDEEGITLAGTYNPVSAADHQIPYAWRTYIRAPRNLTEPALSSRLVSNAESYIGEHPIAPLKVAFDNTLRMLELDGSFAWKASAASIGLERGSAEIGVVSFWILCVLALAGAFTGAARAAPRWLWLAPILFALSIVLVNVETPRFRAPIDPFLVMLAACAVATAARGAFESRPRAA
jgi:4-amino-4-deoxy-L-arabinose transferase-like glycosyltransferase